MNANPQRNRPFRKRSRRGYAMFELTMSVILLMAAMSLTVKLVGWLGKERRSADRRQWAVQTVSNVMERVTSVPFDRVNLETAKAIADGTDAAKVLPESEWVVKVEDHSDTPAPSRKIVLGLRWHDMSGNWTAPVRLNAWVFKREASR